MSRSVVLMLFALLVLSGLVMVGSVFAQSIPKPSVPEFAVELVDTSYDVPTTYSIDPFTGENVTHEGYHVESRTIEVKIKNQPFISYKIEDSAGNSWTINFYYNIRIKGHFSEYWIELYRPSDGYTHQWSDSDYTVFSYVWGGDADTILGTKMIRIPAGSQVDFQVEAMIGYVHREYNPNSTSYLDLYPWVFTGEVSGWSETQTMTIEASQTPSPEPTKSPEPTSPTPTSPPPTTKSSPTPTPTPSPTPTPTPKATSTPTPTPGSTSPTVIESIMILLVSLIPIIIAAVYRRKIKHAQTK